MTAAREDLRCLKDDGVNIRGGVVTVVVGEGANEQTFTIHHTLLRNSSGFFAAALSKDWKEGQDRIVRLPEDNVDAFYCYSQWLYTGKLHCTSPENKEEDWHGCHMLSTCYALGEKLMAINFKDCTIDAIIAAGRYDQMWPMKESVLAIYRATPYGSPARRLMVDMHVAYGRGNWIDGSGEVTNPEFMRDLAKVFLHRRSKPEFDQLHESCALETGNSCYYHCHKVGEPCGKAKA